MNILAGSLAFSLATFFSRIFGLIRDVVLAAFYGASPLLDAYLVAIIFPFFLRKIFGEGALGSSFVPFYKTSEDRDSFTSGVINFFLIITLVIVVLVEIFPSMIPAVFSMGYAVEGKERIEALVRVTVLFVPAVFLWAVFYSILNSHNKFFLPALSPLFMNIGVILGTVIGKDPFWSAVGFVTGGFFSAFVLGFYASKYFKYKFKLFPGKSFISAFLKATASMATAQINLLVDTNVASFFGSGAISYLQLASRLYLLPLGLFGVAVSTVALSVMSGSDEKTEKMKEAISSVLFFSIPAFIGLLVLSDDIVHLIYGTGRFTEADVTMTANILKMYSFGIIPYSVYNIGLRYHHSSKEMTVPLIATVIVSSTNVVLDIVLGILIGVSGVALSTSIAGMVGLLFFTVRKEIHIDTNELLKITISSLFMGFFAYILKDPTNKIWTLILVFLSALIYLFFMKILNSKKATEMLNIIRK